MAITPPDNVPVPDSIATTPASAPSAHDAFQLPARVATALRAPTTDADNQPIPDNVATAERINQRFASVISQSHSIVASIFTHNAPDHTNTPDHCTHTLLPRPPVLGGSFQE